MKVKEVMTGDVSPVAMFNQNVVWPGWIFNQKIVWPRLNFNQNMKPEKLKADPQITSTAGQASRNQILHFSLK